MNLLFAIGGIALALLLVVSYFANLYESIFVGWRTISHKTCLECGKPFTHRGTDKNIILCSLKCQRSYNRRHPRDEDYTAEGGPSDDDF